MKRRRNKRIRKREAIERRAAIAPYLDELERSRVPPTVIKQASKLIALSGRSGATKFQHDRAEGRQPTF
jgi:hypothetical protein